MKNLTKHLLLLITIFPIIILLSSVFAEKSSAQTTNCAGVCKDTEIGCDDDENEVPGTFCENTFKTCCVNINLPPPITNCSSFNNSSFYCNRQTNCIWRSTGRGSGFCDSISTPTPTPIPTSAPAATDCTELGGICKRGFCADDELGGIFTRQCSSIGQNCCAPLSSSRPTLSPSPTPAPRLVWRPIAFCPAPTPTKAPAATDCTDSGGQCIKYNTCPVGQSSTRKTNQCGGELSSLICCISKPTPAPIAIAPTSTPVPPIPTPNPTATPVPPTSKPLATATPKPVATSASTPTKTPIVQPPTPTRPQITIVPTSTPIPTKTPTSIPATAVPTATSQPPTAAPPAPTLSPAQLHRLGDANGDRFIDIIDYNIWLKKFAGKELTAGENPDFNNDGKVDILDYNRWLVSFINKIGARP